MMYDIAGGIVIGGLTLSLMGMLLDILIYKLAEKFDEDDL